MLRVKRHKFKSCILNLLNFKITWEPWKSTETFWTCWTLSTTFCAAEPIPHAIHASIVVGRYLLTIAAWSCNANTKSTTKTICTRTFHLTHKPQFWVFHLIAVSTTIDLTTKATGVHIFCISTVLTQRRVAKHTARRVALHVPCI